MKYDLKQGFGSVYLPIAETGFYCHILDWMPKTKSTWLAWPERLKNAIHPVKGDRLLACYCGPAPEAFYLAPYFEEVHCLDAREWAEQSCLHNAHTANLSSVSFHRKKLDIKWVEEFFAPQNRAGKWTILLNPPESALLSAPLTEAIAVAKPERIVHIIGYLDRAATEIKRWRKCGYVLRKIIPLDINPGSSRYELALLFVPDREGLLGRKPMMPNSSAKKPAPPAPRFVQKTTS
jgi:tRNA/tmRNA/rRNA uracil-C5-methylase (TrmA/RlmC/RlmD family)